MPAIHPARLKQQAILVTQHFGDSAALVRSLHHLLDFYADRASRPSQAGSPAPLLPAYHVKPPVLRQVVLELAPFAQADPESGLVLCQAMWAQPYLEFRLMACSLLGELPPDPTERILAQVKTWAVRDTDVTLLDALARDGLKRVRKEQSAALVKATEGWLSEKELDARRMGLRLLLPYVRQAPGRLRPDILDVLAALAMRSPVETASYLRQALTLPDSPDTAWLIRQSASAFPPEIEERLRGSVRGLGVNPAAG